jgi:protocatechuate 4,5-dioxygenase alpha chain
MTPSESVPVTDEISRRINYDKNTARSLEGTYLFDGARARMNLPLNRMCMSLVRASNRDAFAAHPIAYCREFGLSDPSIALVTARDWLGMIRSGGNIYYVFKLAAIDHLSMQHIGAQQTSMTLEQFRAMLNAVKDSTHG